MLPKVCQRETNPLSWCYEALLCFGGTPMFWPSWRALTVHSSGITIWKRLAYCPSHVWWCPNPIYLSSVEGETVIFGILQCNVNFITSRISRRGTIIGSVCRSVYGHSHFFTYDLDLAKGQGQTSKLCFSAYYHKKLIRSLPKGAFSVLYKFFLYILVLGLSLVLQHIFSTSCHWHASRGRQLLLAKVRTPIGRINKCALKTISLFKMHIPNHSRHWLQRPSVCGGECVWNWEWMKEKQHRTDCL